MVKRGGRRPGSGRKPKVEELKIVNTAIEAITEQHGGLKEGFVWLLKSGEPSLIKFVYEHAAGKPTDKVDMNLSNKEGQIFKINGQVIEF